MSSSRYLITQNNKFLSYKMEIYPNKNYIKQNNSSNHLNKTENKKKHISRA